MILYFKGNFQDTDNYFKFQMEEILSSAYLQQIVIDVTHSQENLKEKLKQLRPYLKLEQLHNCLAPDYLKQIFMVFYDEKDAYFLTPKTKLEIQEDLSTFESFLLKQNCLSPFFTKELNLFE